LEQWVWVSFGDFRFSARAAVHRSPSRAMNLASREMHSLLATASKFPRLASDAMLLATASRSLA